ncbi:PREDICTED: uncharacterized protein LOC108755025 [Trachymyrmex septentrionalis]|uniref:uncharacterized protein LOC108755025 n=1 Tax=Trachymyrmex septentrionalis TaxID=34720 RepID=UPI00084F2B2E|nr:PREDICTED: uncharacterized protein LOC108755025 [Trachymyrmex septentrionalis]
MLSVNVTPIAEKLLATVYSDVKIADPAKFKIGDSYTLRVLYISSKIFLGEDILKRSPNWTTEVFKITKVEHTYPVTYLLNNYRRKSISGTFYEHELDPAAYPDVYLMEKVLQER